MDQVDDPIPQDTIELQNWDKFDQLYHKSNLPFLMRPYWLGVNAPPVCKCKSSSTHRSSSAVPGGVLLACYRYIRIYYTNLIGINALHAPDSPFSTSR